MKQRVVILLLWALTLLGTYFLGFLSRKESTEQQPEIAQVTDTRPSQKEDAAETVDPTRIPGPIQRSLEDLLTLENRGERIYQFEYMVAQLDADSLPAFLEQLQALPPCENRKKWINRVMEKWGELAPQAAAAYIETFPGSDRLDMIGQMAKGWARQDPRNAWEYVKIQSNDGRDFYSGAPDVLMEIAKSNPALAVEFLNEVAGTQNSVLMSRVLTLASREKGHYGELLNAFSGIQNDSDRRMAMRELWQTWAGYEPENAIAAYQAMEDGPEKQEALANLMGGWASKDAGEALAYCLENVPEQNQGGAIKEIVRQWAQNGDLEAAAAFVETLPVNKNSDEAVNAIVHQMAREDAESAMAWVQSMQNEERVRQGQKQVVAYWGGQDFEKAQAFVMEIPPGEQKNESLQTLFYSQMAINRINDNAYSVIPLIEDQDMRDNCVLGLAQRAVFELPARYGMTNTIDKERVAREIINMPGITEEKRQEALAILGVEKPGG